MSVRKRDGNEEEDGNEHRAMSQESEGESLRLFGAGKRRQVLRGHDENRNRRGAREQHERPPQSEGSHEEAADDGAGDESAELDTAHGAHALRRATLTERCHQCVGRWHEAAGGHAADGPCEDEHRQRGSGRED